MSITYLEAIREAQSVALQKNDEVFIYGQDIGFFGETFKSTKGLYNEFPDRVLDSPISEDAMVGLAVGAAIEGMRPIVEMQFADFSSVGFNQIVNQAATLYWRTSLACPITIRLPSGGTPEVVLSIVSVWKLYMHIIQELLSWLLQLLRMHTLCYWMQYQLMIL